jgi:hypothetical protein
MRDQPRQVAFNLAKAEEYRKRMKAAFDAVVREYLEKARACALPRKVGNN